MKITKEQYEQIMVYLPVARGNVKIDNRVLINTLLYMAENGCKWRRLPKEYGKWNSVYRRVNLGVLKRLFYALEKEQIARVGVKLLALDSTSCKVHPGGMGALKKTE
jgi:transposase